MKTGCATILYHPDEQTLLNIQAYASFEAGPVYVLDDSDGEINAVARKISQLPFVRFFRDGENRGLGLRLNQAGRMALKDGVDWLLTMDQDSYFDPSLLRQYLTCAMGFEAKESVALFGVTFGGQPVSEEPCQPREVDELITSGSLMNMSLFEELGAFDEGLFIDGLDKEYCFKARLAGYRLIQLQNIVFDHRIGHLSSHKSLANGRMTTRSLHSPARLYYMTRNYLYLQKKYGRLLPADLKAYRKDWLNRVKNNLLYNQRRWAVLRSILKGISAYYSGRRNKGI